MRTFSPRGWLRGERTFRVRNMRLALWGLEDPTCRLWCFSPTQICSMTEQEIMASNIFERLVLRRKIIYLALRNHLTMEDHQEPRTSNHHHRALQVGKTLLGPRRLAPGTSRWPRSQNSSWYSTPWTTTGAVTSTSESSRRYSSYSA